MKRTMITAVGLICFGMGLVNAEELKLNFDGQGTNALRSVSFPAAPEAGKPEALKLSGDEAASLQGVSKEELEKSLDQSIQTAVKYCEKNNISATKGNLEKLGIYGTFEEKYQFVYNMEKNYSFPGWIAGARSDKMGGMGESCVNQSICRVVCMTAGMGAGIAIAGGSMGTGMAVGMVVGTAAGGVCMELCSLIKECSPLNLFKPKPEPAVEHSSHPK